MGFFDKFNGTSTVRPEVGDIKEWPFVALKEFEGEQLKVDGFFFTEGKYGRQVVVVANGSKVNMPGYAVKIFDRIAADDEAVNMMLDGNMAISDIEPLETRNGTTTEFKVCEAAELVWE